jgi:hypothetical protein
MAFERRGPIRRSWVLLITSVLFLLIAILLILSGVLVRLSNDRAGKPILPGEVNPGQKVSGEVVLTDSGLMPIAVTLEPRTSTGQAPDALPADVTVTIQRAGDNAYLYDGPLTSRMGPFENLAPGEASRLRITVAADDPHAVAAVPLGYSWYWSAEPASPWWWWLPFGAFALVVATWVYRGRLSEMSTREEPQA